MIVYGTNIVDILALVSNEKSEYCLFIFSFQNHYHFVRKLVKLWQLLTKYVQKL
jgi:hypothetical protein